MESEGSNMEQKKLFREKSLEKISSPEQLNTYIKVSNAGVWMVISAMIIFLIGVLIWGIFGRIETFEKAVARVESGNVEVYVPYISFENQQVPQPLRFEINNAAFSIDLGETVPEPLELTEDEVEQIDSLASYLGDFHAGDWIYVFKGQIDYPDGVYECNVVTQEYAPISFVTN